MTALAPISNSDDQQSAPATGDRPVGGDRLARFRTAPNRRPLIIGGLVVTIGLVIALVAWGYAHRPKATGSTSATPSAAALKQAAPPPKAPAPLTGLQIDQSAAQKPIVGVMIENLDPDARPQSGLADAGVVYETLAEGGITRFLALFQLPVPSSIGPVRSLRPYYLDWGLEFNAPVIHAGGSQPALAAIGPRGLKNVEALVYGAPYFTRTSDRVAPHNLYTDTDGVQSILDKLGFATRPDFTQWSRKDDAAATTPPHPAISLDFGSKSYDVSYQFDAASDSYARSLAGAPHTDRNSGKQIMVKNIIVEFVPTSYSTQPDGKPETDLNLVGTGKAMVFRDGDEADATWKKASDAAATEVVDGSGNPFPLNRGNTWIEVLPVGSAVTD